MTTAALCNRLKCSCQLLLGGYLCISLSAFANTSHPFFSRLQNENTYYFLFACATGVWMLERVWYYQYFCNLTCATYKYWSFLQQLRFCSVAVTGALQLSTECKCVHRYRDFWHCSKVSLYSFLLSLQNGIAKLYQFHVYTSSSFHIDWNEMLIRLREKNFILHSWCGAVMGLAVTFFAFASKYSSVHDCIAVHNDKWSSIWRYDDEYRSTVAQT